MCFICDGMKHGRWTKLEAKVQFERMIEGNNELINDIEHYSEMLTEINKTCVVCFFKPCRCSEGHMDRLRKI